MMRESGFTLIELMITLVIVAIALVLGLPSYSTWIANSRVRVAAESIQNGLQLARAEAVSRNATVQVVVAADSGWTLGCTNVSATCPAVIETRAASEGSSGTTVLVSNASTANTVYFGGFGGSVTAAATPAPDRVDIDVDSSVLSQAQSRELRVSVFQNGSTRMCDPALGGADPRRCVN